MTELLACSTGCSDSPEDDAKCQSKSPCGPSGDGSDASSNVDADSGSSSTSGDDARTTTPDAREQTCGACSPDPDLPSTFGWVSLDCACSTRSAACLDYTTVIAACSPNVQIVRYPSCNLEVLRYNSSFDAYKMVYDATTHALVGTEFTVDDPSLPCGNSRVVGYRAGTFPPSDCPPTGSRNCADPALQR
ncbi:MAG: hypothetical protein ABW133_23740 [Polyangiaceae bacterium]